MRLWVDDLREPPDETWLWAKSSKKAVGIICTSEIDFISFDFDLGGDDTSMDVATLIEGRAERGIQPPGWAIHSQNPVGRIRLRSALDSAERIWRQHVRSNDRNQRRTS